MTNDNKKRQRKQHKAQKANELKAKFEQEKDLKNEAYFFIIESGNFDNFKKWIDNRRQDGLTAATAHAETICFLSGAKETIRLTVTDPDKWEKAQRMKAEQSTDYQQPTNADYLKTWFKERKEEITRHTCKPDTAPDLVATLRDCNATQRRLIQLQEERLYTQEKRITQLIGMLAEARKGGCNGTV